MCACSSESCCARLYRVECHLRREASAGRAATSLLVELWARKLSRRTANLAGPDSHSPVLDGVVGAPRQVLGDQRPLVAVLGVALHAWHACARGVHVRGAAGRGEGACDAGPARGIHTRLPLMMQLVCALACHQSAVSLRPPSRVNAALAGCAQSPSAAPPSTSTSTSAAPPLPCISGPLKCALPPCQQTRSLVGALPGRWHVPACTVLARTRTRTHARTHQHDGVVLLWREAALLEVVPQLVDPPASPRAHAARQSCSGTLSRTQSEKTRAEQVVASCFPCHGHPTQPGAPRVRISPSARVCPDSSAPGNTGRAQGTSQHAHRSVPARAS